MKRIFVALAVLVALLGLSACAVRERIAIDTGENSYIYNGADVIFYSDNHSTEKARLLGDTGAVYATGVITADGGIVQSSGTPGLTVLGNITMSTGSLINANGAITVSDSLLVNSQLTASNGIAATGVVTVTGAGSYSSQLTASNGIAATGVVTVTGSESVSKQLTTDGIYSTNPVTLTDALTVTNWGFFYGLVMQPAQTLPVTTNVQITVGNYSLIYLQTGEASDAGVVVALDGTNAISDGAYVGQILVVVNVDADTADIVIHDGKNTAFGAAGDIDLKTIQDSAILMWNGTDWICLAVNEG